MNTYHSRHPEKSITDHDELVKIIYSQKYMTLAMCKDNKPYLVTLNYAFDHRRNCFYFHSAHTGKKMDFLAVNPIVWGQVMEDLGYLEGECDHAYRTVHFKGTAEVIEDMDEKRYAFHLMIDQLEANPEPMKKKFIDESSFKAATIIRVQVEGMIGKLSPKG